MSSFSVTVTCGSNCSIYDNDTLLVADTMQSTVNVSSGVLKVVVDSAASIDTKKSTGGVTLTSTSGNTLTYAVTTDGTVTITTIEL